VAVVEAEAEAEAERGHPFGNVTALRLVVQGGKFTIDFPVHEICSLVRP
jgi:hypothetical protein